MNLCALALLLLLAACGAEPDPSPEIVGYKIIANADLVGTSTVDASAILYSVLVEEGVGFESMACAESTVYKPMSHWVNQGNVAGTCGGSMGRCFPLMIFEGFRPYLSSPVRLQLYAVLAVDEASSLLLRHQDKPPVIPGDLYGVSPVFEIQPDVVQTILPDPILMDQVFQGCP